MEDRRVNPYESIPIDPRDGADPYVRCLETAFGLYERANYIRGKIDQTCSAIHDQIPVIPLGALAMFAMPNGFYKPLLNAFRDIRATSLEDRADRLIGDNSNPV